MDIYSDPLIRVVAVSGVSVVGLAILMMVMVVVMRVRFILLDRHRKRFLETWRPLMVQCLHEFPNDLPAIVRSDTMLFLYLWNYYQEAMLGEVKDHLSQLGRVLGMDREARGFLQTGNIRKQLLGIVTLGHLGEKDAREELYDFTGQDNPVLSLAAVRALIQIEKEDAVPVVMPLLCTRTDWPQDKVASIIKEAGGDLVVKPLGQIALNAPANVQPRLIRFLEATDSHEYHFYVQAIIQSAKDPEVIAECLRALIRLGDPRDGEIVRTFTGHPAWRVRAQTAVALGKIGVPEDEPGLVAMLQDEQWWVRYRAAQALAALPFVGVERYKELLGGETDTEARNVLAQVMVEEEMI